MNRYQCYRQLHYCHCHYQRTHHYLHFDYFHCFDRLHLHWHALAIYVVVHLHFLRYLNYEINKKLVQVWNKKKNKIYLNRDHYLNRYHLSLRLHLLLPPKIEQKLSFRKPVKP